MIDQTDRGDVIIIIWGFNCWALCFKKILLCT